MFHPVSNKKSPGGEQIFQPIARQLSAGLIFLALALSFGCSSDDKKNPVTPVAPTPLSLVSVSPAAGATGVALTTTIVATFNKALDTATVTSSTFFITGESGTISVNGKVATITPSAKLAENQTYTVNITTGMKDFEGQSLASAATSTFTTALIPVASAGDDQDVTAGAAVTLNGSSNVISGAVYAWTQTAGPTVGVLTGATPSFTAPSDVSTLAFELTVGDGINTSGKDAVVVYVLEDGSNALWVGPGGDDTNAGTRSAPLLTLNAAIDAANTGGAGADVYVGAGTYSESVTLKADVSVYGGFGGSSWFRDIAVNKSIIDGGAIAVRGTSANNVTLDGLTINSADATVSSASSTAVRFVSSNNVVITNNEINAGAGANGIGGANRTRPATQPNGASGRTSGTGGAGGNGVGNDGGKGGKGGGFLGGGTTGASGFGSNGGGGGRGGGSGSNGSSGGSGFSGASGGHSPTGGLTFGIISSGVYFVSNGSSGFKGGNGGGAGGGGGSGGGFFTSGGGGGGGGSGGIGGSGGGGGAGAGGSFGIILSNSSSAQLRNNIITTSDGGKGGAGGNGALGGVGGSGGFGAKGSSGATGGKGGFGGSGGRGGNGGSGGGGPSIGIVTAIGSSAFQTNNTITLGPAGIGGSRTDNLGASGQNGEKVETKNIP